MAPPSPTANARVFWSVLGVILLVALAVRVVFVFGYAQDDQHFYDAAYYQLQAEANADGHWFRDPWPFVTARGPAADHPPMTALVLTPVAAAFTGNPELPMRLTMVVLGLGVIVLVALLGREVGGRRVGLLAGAIAAVYPYLWMNDGLIMSETLAAGTTVAAVLLTYRLRRRPGPALAVALGAVCGVAALTRAELALLAPLLVVPVAVGARAVATRTRVLLVVATLGVAALVVAPWALWNASRFDDPVLISTNEGVALAGSNCDHVFRGTAIGLTDLRCLDPVPRGDQSVQSTVYRRRALDYVRDHASRFPVVLAARVGRTWSLFRPNDMLDINQGEGRPRWATALGLAFYYPLVLLAVGGTVVLVRRRRSVWPLLAPVVVVTAGTLLTYGQTRFRVPAEPSIVVLGAFGAVAAFDALRARRRGGPAVRPTAAAPVPT